MEVQSDETQLVREAERRDIFRHYVDKALAVLKIYHNAHTGFISVHRGLYENKHESIVPTYENFLFVLLLLQKRTHETVLEAKRLLSQMLYYQNHVEQDQYGNFPHELTAYPYCENWSIPFVVGPIYALIIREFAGVLGDGLIARLRKSFTDLYACALRTQQKTTISYSNKIVLAAAYAQIVHDDASIDPLIDAFLVSDEWKSPSCLGYVLTTLSWLPEYCSRLLPYIYWHDKACTYQGPPMHVLQFESSPEITLLDMACSLSRNKRLLDRPWTYKNGLEVALLNPEYHVQPMPILRDDILTIGEVVIAVYKGQHSAIRIVTPDATLYMVCEGLISIEKTEDGCIGTVDSTYACPGEMLARWYVERSPSVHMSVQGKEASVFVPEEGISCLLKQAGLHLSFITHEAHCFGHVSLQNRPGQIYKNMADIGYDWCINVEYMRGALGPCWQWQVKVI